MRRLPTLVALIALAAMAGPPSAIAGECQGGDVRPAGDNLAQVGQSTLCLINGERASAGLSPVTEQAQLTKASVSFSNLMVANRFFAHVSPDGSELTDRLTAAGYLGQPGSWIVGENIAWGESHLATPREIVKAWMNSAPHRANILKASYEEIGLGIAVGTPSTSNPGATYTTDFGQRRLDDAAPASDAKGDLTVGQSDAAAPASSGTSKRSSAIKARPRTARRAGRSGAGSRSCRSASRRVRTARHAVRRGYARTRCAAAWLSVSKHL